MFTVRHSWPLIAIYQFRNTSRRCWSVRATDYFKVAFYTRCKRDPKGSECHGYNTDFFPRLMIALRSKYVRMFTVRHCWPLIAIYQFQNTSRRCWSVRATDYFKVAFYTRCNLTLTNRIPKDQNAMATIPIFSLD